MLTIRMRRLGAKKRPFFRVVVTERRRPRDGRVIEVLGHYDPVQEQEKLNLNRKRLEHWLSKGARPSDTLRTLLAQQSAGESSETSGTSEAPNGAGADE